MGTDGVGRPARVMLALRVAPETITDLTTEAARVGVSRSVLARTLLEEGLRARRGPGVTTVPDEVAGATPDVPLPAGGTVVPGAGRGRPWTTDRPPFAGPVPKGGRR